MMYGYATEAALEKFQCAEHIVCSGTPSTTGYGAVGPKTAAALDVLEGASEPGVPASTTAYAFTRDLTLGSTGSDVKALQEYLNSHGFPVASSGIGSPGDETDYFGSLTQSALAKFQAANGISPALGYFGPETREYVEGHPFNG
jgi:peptidoglycan hydrolase-like protein with peptidoglycan-binding domain